VKARREDDAVDRAVEGTRPVEVVLVERAALRYLSEVRARAQRKRRARRQELRAGIGRDLEPARAQVDARDGDAVDLEGASQQLERLLGRCERVGQRSEAQGSSSKTSMTS
jgi:hypothetical protein